MFAIDFPHSVLNGYHSFFLLSIFSGLSNVSIVSPSFFFHRFVSKLLILTTTKNSFSFCWFLSLPIKILMDLTDVSCIWQYYRMWALGNGYFCHPLSIFMYLTHKTKCCLFALFKCVFLCSVFIFSRVYRQQKYKVWIHLHSIHSAKYSFFVFFPQKQETAEEVREKWMRKQKKTRVTKIKLV